MKPGRTWTARSSASLRRTCRSRSRRRSSARCCRRSTTSGRHAVSSSPTSTTTVDVTMPQMGVSVAEGTIADWKKKPGDWIERDETIVEISTDKIETEIPSPAAGRVTEILVEVGVTVPVGEVLARIDTGSKPGQAHASEDASDDGAGMGGGGDAEAPAPSSPNAAPEPAHSNGGNGEHAPPISPVVRRIAAEHHVNLDEVHGTGMRGRITKRDVLAFLENAEPKQ